MTPLEEYYNKFNEEKRLDSRHGRVEFIVSMKYIHECLDICGKDSRILDIGAGTGRYSIPLCEEGYEVTAIELVKHNLGLLKAKNSNVIAKQGNALNLKKLPEKHFDVTLLFGPMYHLLTMEDKITALKQAIRVTKKGGFILVAYVMNDYGVITHAFKDQNITACLEENRLTPDFKIITKEDDLYDYVRLSDIDAINSAANISRVKIISPDGPANYMRPFLNKLSEEEYRHFVEYQLANCERLDLIGAGAHTVDILRV